MMTTYDDLVLDIGWMEHGCDAFTKHSRGEHEQVSSGVLERGSKTLLIGWKTTTPLDGKETRAGDAWRWRESLDRKEVALENSTVWVCCRYP